MVEHSPIAAAGRAGNATPNYGIDTLDRLSAPANAEQSVNTYPRTTLNSGHHRGDCRVYGQDLPPTHMFHESETERMTRDSYFDVRTLEPLLPHGQRRCPVIGCTAQLVTVDSQWGAMPCCQDHRIRIHGGSSTFVYFDGASPEQKRAAAMRNIRFEPNAFANILGNPAKAETHRICNETSEDALTWNVFSALLRANALSRVASTLAGVKMAAPAQLYLWGLPIALDGAQSDSQFGPLINARSKFEAGIRRFHTEPDIIVHLPGELLILCEAKFTSGNTVAKAGASEVSRGEKPRTMSGIAERYHTPDVTCATSRFASTGAPAFYSQLYRNMVFASYMSEELGVPWILVSLVSELQCGRALGVKSGATSRPEYDDPTAFAQEVLGPNLQNRFVRYSWERLYSDHVASDGNLTRLADYMRNKSAFCTKAFDL